MMKRGFGRCETCDRWIEKKGTPRRGCCLKLEEVVEAWDSKYGDRYLIIDPTVPATFGCVLHEEREN